MTPTVGTWSSVPRAVYTGGNEVRLLEGGDQLFPAMCAAINRARHDVWVAAYIFHDDETALRVMRALVASAQRGVRVRVVVDGFGSKATLPALHRELTAGGVALAVFRPMDRWYAWLQPGQLRRLHQKMCVIDESVAFIGGVNIIDDRFDLRHGSTKLPRLDFAIEVRGPMAAAVEQAARAVWTRAWLGRDFREELMSLARSAEPVARTRALLRKLRMPRGGLASHEGELPPVRAAFVLRDNFRQRRTIERSYIDAIRSATDRVDLMSPYFYPGHRFRRELRRAARRGVRVRLLLQGKLDYRIAGLAAHVLYAELIAAGVRIYEYTPAFLHAKIAVIDHEWATVGSSNIDPLSLLLNLEANVIVRDVAFNTALSKAFDAAVEVSREVIAAELPARGLTPVVMRGLVAWCAHVYLRLAGATGRY